MQIVVFGLSISSTWGNGHATLWRGLCSALGDRGHRVIFFERDVPYYAGARDGLQFRGCDLRLYRDWEEIAPVARRAVAGADAAMVTSYCPDAIPACDLVLGSNTLRVYYDLDTPVTLSRLASGDRVEYVPDYGLGGFDVVLSYTGGRALGLLKERLGARRTAPLYGSVDPSVHRPAAPSAEFRGDLSYLGTYAPDRQEVLQRLLLDVAGLSPGKRFLMAGAQYPHEFPWTPNLFFVRHLPPAQHATFYASSRLTLNVTRSAMAAMGYCPSGRLFEAAACGAPIASDAWPGIEAFFEPGSEILLCRSTGDVLAALDLPDGELARIAGRARERTLSEHTAARRALELENVLEEAACRAQAE